MARLQLCIAVIAGWNVYAVHESGGGLRRTLQLLGYPIRFSVDQNGKFTDLVDRGLPTPGLK